MLDMVLGEITELSLWFNSTEHDPSPFRLGLLLSLERQFVVRGIDSLMDDGRIV